MVSCFLTRITTNLPQIIKNNSWKLTPLNLRFRESFMDIRVEKGLPPQFDFLIAAKLIHLVSNVVFEALDVLFVGIVTNKPTIIRGKFTMKKYLNLLCS